MANTLQTIAPAPARRIVQAPAPAPVPPTPSATPAAVKAIPEHLDEVTGGGSFSAPALSNSLQVANVPARLLSLIVFNTGPNQYIQIFDSAGVPAALAVPKIQVKCLTDDDRSIDFSIDSDSKGKSLRGLPFRNGIFVGNSTTSGTYTPGAADCLWAVHFRKGK